MSKEGDRYRELVVVAIKEADKLLEERGKDYNMSGVDIPDYFKNINDEIKACFQMVGVKNTRLKSLVNNPKQTIAKKIESVLDNINYLRFMFAILKLTEEKVYKIREVGDHSCLKELRSEEEH